MGQLLMISMTLLLLSVLIYRNRQIDKGLIYSIRQVIHDINHMYVLLFSKKKTFVRWIEIGLVSFAESSTFTSIYTATLRYLEIHESYRPIEPFIQGGVIIVAFLMVHYAIGYVLFLSSRIHLFIYRVENKNLKVDFLLVYAIISTFLEVLLLFPDQFAKNIPLGLVGMGACYYLNLKTLLVLMTNPTHVKSINQENTSFTRIMIAAILILLLLILNLYLMVCLVYHLPKHGVAFANANNYFDLFYYTIITFTTIGYGDIVPVTIAAKMVSMLISMTSVLSLSVFLSSILSYKDKLTED